MKKSDLKVFDVVQLRNEECLMVLPNDYAKENKALFNKDHACFKYLESYTDDLICIDDNKYDIMKVVDLVDERYCTAPYGVMQSLFDRNYKYSVTTHAIKWKWERVENEFAAGDVVVITNDKWCYSNDPEWFTSRVDKLHPSVLAEYCNKSKPLVDEVAVVSYVEGYRVVVITESGSVYLMHKNGIKKAKSWADNFIEM